MEQPRQVAKRLAANDERPLRRRWAAVLSILTVGYLNNLSALGEDSNEIRELCLKYIFQPFWNTIRKSEVGIWVRITLGSAIANGQVDVSNHREESKLFWKETLRHMFFNMGTSTIRDKAMDHFLKR